MTALFENRDANLPFDGNPLREAIEKAAQLRTLTEHPGWAILEQEARLTIEAEQRYVMAGNCKSQEEYQARLGKANGALAVLNLPETFNEHVRAQQAREAAPNEEE